MRESIRLDQNILNKTLSENVTYDTIFMLDQYPIDAISYLIRNIFCGVEEKLGIQLPTHTIAFIINALDILYSKFTQKNQLKIFYEDKLINKIMKINRAVSKNDVKKFLRMFSMKISCLNENFEHAMDYLSIDAHFRPIIKIDKKRYLIISPSLFSLSYFSSIRHIGLSKIPKTEGGRIGGAIDQTITKNNFEKLVQNLFVNKGFIVHKGQYKENLESDLVVESDRYIYAIECKIGTFAKKAKSGDLIKLYDNLDVLFKSQKQAYAIEYYLKKDGKIEFNNNESKSILKLNNRRVIKISLSLYDFLGFQDMSLVSHILSELYGCTLSTDNEEHNFQTVLNRMNENLNAITQYIDEIARLNDEKYELTKNLRKITSNSLFLCFGHLYAIMKYVSKKSDLDDILPMSYSSGTQNFYVELRESLKLKDKIKTKKGEKMIPKIFFNKRDV